MVTRIRTFAAGIWLAAGLLAPGRGPIREKPLARFEESRSAVGATGCSRRPPQQVGRMSANAERSGCIGTDGQLQSITM